MREAKAILERWREIGGPMALATVLSVEGSSYRRPGARMLIDPEGGLTGSVSGGCLERDLARRGLQCIASGVSTLMIYDTTEDGDELESFSSAGLGCNGVVRIWIERVEAEHPVRRALEQALERREPAALRLWGTPRGEGGYGPVDRADAFVLEETIRPPLPLVIVGAGHDVPPVIALAEALGWDTTVVDCRSALSLPGRHFRGAGRFVRREPSEVVVPDEAAVLLMTHHYFHDKEVLRVLLAREPLLYLGLLGPKKRSRQMLSELEREGAPIRGDSLARLHSPVGLDLGAETPAEIALSAIAEIQAARTGARATALRNRRGPIHAREAS